MCWNNTYYAQFLIGRRRHKMLFLGTFLVLSCATLAASLDGRLPKVFGRALSGRDEIEKVLQPVEIFGNIYDPALHARDVQKDLSNSKYIITQAPSPSTRQQIELRELGAIFHQVVGRDPSLDTSLYSYKAKDLKPILALPWMSYAGPYPPFFKVDPHLQPREGSAPGSRDVVIVFHQDVDATSDVVLSAVAKQARVDPKTLKPDGPFLVIRVEERYLSDLATIDEVLHIEEDVKIVVYNNVARRILKADVVQKGFDGQGYSGEGQVVAVADTGFERVAYNACLGLSGGQRPLCPSCSPSRHLACIIP